MRSKPGGGELDECYGKGGLVSENVYTEVSLLQALREGHVAQTRGQAGWVLGLSELCLRASE